MKIAVFSHESDIDGLGNIVLAKKAFKEIDYHLFPSLAVLEEGFRDLLTTQELDQYDKIFITDLALANPALEMVSKNPNISSKLRVFDHHKASIDEGLGVYSFTKIEEEDSTGKKRCGTELFYEYLVNSGYLERTSILDDFVELTRLEDTWEWKKSGERGLKAHDLAILFDGIGCEAYIEAMLKKVDTNDVEIKFTDEEEDVVATKKREYEAILQDLWDATEVFTDEFDNPYGVVYAEYGYRNELAEYIRRQEDRRGIKYIIIIALEKGLAGQKSYRSIEEGFDVNSIAVLHGGGGHVAAASVNMTQDQKTKVMTLTKREGLEYLAKSSFTTN